MNGKKRYNITATYSFIFSVVINDDSGADYTH